MVDEYNRLAREQGHSEQKMHAVQGDILAPTETPYADLSSADFSDFDLIVVSMALHHVQEPQAIMKTLAQKLRSGGTLLIVDWLASEESNCSSENSESHHAAKHTVSRHGFNEGEMRDYMKDAGLVPDWKLFASKSKVPREISGEKQLFLSKGRKQ